MNMEFPLNLKLENNLKLLQYGRCLQHSNPMKFVCFDKKCIEDLKCFLCNECITNHDKTNQHMLLEYSYVFSDKFRTELIEFYLNKEKEYNKDNTLSLSSSINNDYRNYNNNNIDTVFTYSLMEEEKTPINLDNKNYGDNIHNDIKNVKDVNNYVLSCISSLSTSPIPSHLSMHRKSKSDILSNKDITIANDDKKLDILNILNELDRIYNDIKLDISEYYKSIINGLDDIKNQIKTFIEDKYNHNNDMLYLDGMCRKFFQLQKELFDKDFYDICDEDLKKYIQEFSFYFQMSQKVQKSYGCSSIFTVNNNNIILLSAKCKIKKLKKLSKSIKDIIKDLNNKQCIFNLEDQIDLRLTKNISTIICDKMNKDDGEITKIPSEFFDSPLENYLKNLFRNNHKKEDLILKDKNQSIHTPKNICKDVINDMTKKIILPDSRIYMNTLKNLNYDGLFTAILNHPTCIRPAFTNNKCQEIQKKKSLLMEEEWNYLQLNKFYQKKYILYYVDLNQFNNYVDWDNLKLFIYNIFDFKNDKKYKSDEERKKDINKLFEIINQFGWDFHEDFKKELKHLLGLKGVFDFFAGIDDWKKSLNELFARFKYFSNSNKIFENEISSSRKFRLNSTFFGSKMSKANNNNNTHNSSLRNTLLKESKTDNIIYQDIAKEIKLLEPLIRINSTPKFLTLNSIPHHPLINKSMLKISNCYDYNSYNEMKLKLLNEKNGIVEEIGYEYEACKIYQEYEHILTSILDHDGLDITPDTRHEDIKLRKNFCFKYIEWDRLINDIKNDIHKMLNLSIQNKSKIYNINSTIIENFLESFRSRIHLLNLDLFRISLKVNHDELNALLVYLSFYIVLYLKDEVNGLC